MRLHWIVATSLLPLAGCGRTPAEPGVPLPIVAAADAHTTRMDPASITGARIDGDRIHVQVRFGGGCTDHDFALLNSGLFLESLPVQTDLRLAHDAHGDRCRALLTRELTFDLTPLRQHYRNAYQTNTGAIRLHLAEPGATAGTRPLTLLYEF